MTTDRLNARCVQYYRKPVRSTAGQKYDVSIAHLYSYIANPDCYGAVTAQLRSIADEKQRKQFKTTRLDYALFSGLFDSREDKGLRSHSGFICFDFDHLGSRLASLKQQLMTDPEFETVLLFTSPSGDGLKWVTDIDLGLADHRDWFYGVDQYLWEAYGIRSDRSCANVSRACLLCHDPEAYVHPACFTQDNAIINNENSNKDEKEQ